MVELDQFKYTLSTYEAPLKEVRDSLNLDAKIRRIDELDKTMEEPSFWEDAEQSTKLVKEAKNLKDTVNEFKRLQDQYEEIGLLIEIAGEENDSSVLPEIQKMLGEFTTELDALRLRTLLTGEYDGNNAILRLNAGAGGTESCDWCSMLYRTRSWMQKTTMTALPTGTTAAPTGGFPALNLIPSTEKPMLSTEAENG